MYSWMGKPARLLNEYCFILHIDGWKVSCCLSYCYQCTVNSYYLQITASKLKCCTLLNLKPIILVRHTTKNCFSFCRPVFLSHIASKICFAWLLWWASRICCTPTKHSHWYNSPFGRSTLVEAPLFSNSVTSWVQPKNKQTNETRTEHWTCSWTLRGLRWQGNDSY